MLLCPKGAAEALCRAGLSKPAPAGCTSPWCAMACPLMPGKSTASRVKSWRQLQDSGSQTASLLVQEQLAKKTWLLLPVQCLEERKWC